MARQITRDLDQRDGIRVAISHYPAGLAMGRHAHDDHQISLLLAGEVEETSGTCTRDMSGPSLGVKAAGRAHANRYGPNGALILSVNLSSRHEMSVDLPASGWSWQKATRSEILLAHSIARSGNSGELPGLALDLIASAAGVDEKPQREPPVWARRLRDQIRDGIGPVDLGEAAREAGIHRGHVSRGFRKSFGIPPSLYGLRCRIARAIDGLARGEPAADAACGSGFSDQSHFIRSLKRETGFTPQALSQLLATG